MRYRYSYCFAIAWSRLRTNFYRLVRYWRTGRFRKPIATPYYRNSTIRPSDSRFFHIVLYNPKSKRRSAFGHKTHISGPISPAVRYNFFAVCYRRWPIGFYVSRRWDMSTISAPQFIGPSEKSFFDIRNFSFDSVGLRLRPLNVL